MASAVGVLMALNFINLLLGLLANVLLAHAFGASGQKDAIEAALAIPRNLVLSFGLTSLGGSTLYVIGRASNGSVEEIGRFVRSVLSVQVAYACLFLLALLVFERPIVEYMSPGMSEDQRTLLTSALVWTRWIVLLQPLAILFGSAATGIRLFGTIPLGATFERLGILAGGATVAFAGPLSYPVGAVGGLFLAVAVLASIAGKHGLLQRGAIDLRSKEMREAMKLSLPWMATAPLVNLSNWILIPLMIGLGSGAYSSYVYALTLNSMLVALLLTPLSDAMAPGLAKHASAAAAVNDGANKRAEQIAVRAGFRLSLAVGVLVAALSVVAAKPLVGILFLRGALATEAAERIAILTMVMSAGLIARSITIFCARLFQARISMWNYVIVQVLDPLIAIPLAFTLVPKLGLYGVAVGATSSVIVGAALSVYLAAREVGRLPFTIEPRLQLWLLMAGLGCAGVLAMGGHVERSLLHNLGWLALSGGVVIGLFSALGRALKVPEFNQLVALIARMHSRIWRRLAFHRTSATQGSDS